MRLLLLLNWGSVVKANCLFLTTAERCHVLRWSKVKSGEIPVNVRELSHVSTATQEQNNSSTQRFVSFRGNFIELDWKSPKMWSSVFFFSFFGYRSINPPSAMTCSSVAAVPEGPSVPLLMLKVNPHKTPVIMSQKPKAPDESTCNFCFSSSSRALCSRGTIIPQPQLPSTP